MSGAVGTYGFINAKVRTKRSALLSESLLKKLAETKSLQDFFTILSHTRFQQFTEKARGSSPVVIEMLLMKEEVQDLQSIIKKSPKVPRQFTQLLIQRYDLERLKEVLRAWHKKEKTPAFSFSEKVIHDFPIDAMIQTERLMDLTRLLSDTPYYKMLTNIAPIYEKMKSVFPVELALDKDLFKKINEAIQTLPANDRKIAKRLLGLEIDLINIQWLYRFNHYYTLKSDEISSHLIPNGLHFDLNDFNFSKGISLGSVIQKVFPEKLLKISDDAEESDNFIKLEQILFSLLKKDAHWAFRQSPFSIGSLLGYYYLLRIEMKNLRALITAKLYDLPYDRCVSLLVL